MKLTAARKRGERARMCVCDYLSPSALLFPFSQKQAQDLTRLTKTKQTNEQNKGKGVGSGRATDKTDRQTGK